MAGKKNEISHKTALELLKLGNDRYVADQADRPNATRRRRLETGSGQWPFAIVLTCADSRVAPELIFDQGVGDIFVVRVAGNVASSEVIGSIQYAVKYIQTELVVVLGHEGCGAVNAVLDPTTAPSPPKELATLAGDIQKVICPKKKNCCGMDLQTAVEKNAWGQAKSLHKKLKKSGLLKRNGVKCAKVRAASYSLKSGKVHWL